MNENKVKTGFVKRAAEYGINEVTANWLFKKGAAGLFANAAPQIHQTTEMTSPQLAAGFNTVADGLDGMRGYMAPIVGALGGHLVGNNLSGPGALAGAGIGGLAGLLDGRKDEKGETHRLRNALTGAGIGGGVGAATGYGTGLVGAGLPLGFYTNSMLSNGAKALHSAADEIKQ